MTLSIFKRAGDIGIQRAACEEQKRKIRITNFAALWAFLVLSYFIIFNLFHGNLFIAFVNFAAVLLFFVILFCNHKYAYDTAKFLMFIVFPLMLWPFNLMLGEVGSENYYFALLVLAFYILDKNIYRYLLSVFYIALFFSIRLIIKSGISLEMCPHLTEYYYWPNTLNAFIMLILISVIYTRQNQHHLAKLNSQNTDLNRQNLYIKKLSKELNHRIKNNLQIVSGLFNLQRYNTDNQELNNALADASKRIITISLLHKKLYQEDSDSTEVLIRDYIDDLCSYLIQSSDLDEDIEFSLDAENISIPIEESVHLGLIVNEAVTNAIKYAFHNTDYKKIKVTFRKKGNMAKIKVEDNGKGFPKNFNPEKTDHFGIFLIRTIADYRDGTYSFYNESGAVVEVTFKFM